MPWGRELSDFRRLISARAASIPHSPAARPALGESGGYFGFAGLFEGGCTRVSPYVSISSLLGLPKARNKK